MGVYEQGFIYDTDVHSEKDMRQKIIECAKVDESDIEFTDRPVTLAYYFSKFKSFEGYESGKIRYLHGRWETDA